uniref:Putative secreted protein n=1 Tax=Rhipicephalus microplus TaxID=6941 RepID=A0A6M2DC40_RHIMP
MFCFFFFFFCLFYLYNTFHVAKPLNIQLQVSPCTLEWLGCAEIPHAEQEAEMVAEILGGEPLLGADATKEMVLGRMGQAECIHIASHVSWKVRITSILPWWNSYWLIASRLLYSPAAQKRSRLLTYGNLLKQNIYLNRTTASSEISFAL